MLNPMIGIDELGDLFLGDTEVDKYIPLRLGDRLSIELGLLSLELTYFVDGILRGGNTPGQL
eukprot:XP_001704217.1 Hypothetical protein GL50803_114662 [Giardia lamblia ATCC 50803]